MIEKFLCGLHATFKKTLLYKFKQNSTASQVLQRDSKELENQQFDDQQDKNALTDLLDQFRAITANIEKDANDPNAPSWSNSLLRVANFISDKIATPNQPEENQDSDFCTLPRGRQMQRSGNGNGGNGRSSSIVQGFRALGFRSNSINPRDAPSSRPLTAPDAEQKKDLPPLASKQKDLNGNPMARMPPRPVHKSSSMAGKKRSVKKQLPNSTFQTY